MRWLLFLSRLAFICGVFFLLSISLLIRDWTRSETISSSVIILGYFIGLIIVPVVNLCYIFVFLIKRKLAVYVPAWLVTANVFFLIILILYIFYFNDPYYHQK